MKFKPGDHVCAVDLLAVPPRCVRGLIVRYVGEVRGPAAHVHVVAKNPLDESDYVEGAEEFFQLESEGEECTANKPW